MGRRQCLIAFIVSALLFAGLVRPAEPAQKIRIACVGDSITYGLGIRDRANDSYPEVLGDMLGNEHEVRNLGVIGATLMFSGDLSYRRQKAFQEARRFRPDIVIIELGTNDSKPKNWRFRDWFEGDLKSMIDHFAALPSKPKIWLCTPPPAIRNHLGVSEKVIKDEIIPIIERVAKERSLGVIDLHEALSNKAELFPDGVHPNDAGARIIAERVKAAISD